ncbi:hypothetical protein LSTR_LSTR005763 [Laodelphax striatellus]|uniref:SAM domain-containing protein n=1 Tax=Laodelphax striatellus TaxID=195883 RepID=A0A482X012_LAOST|nr:hypothetical protein LSTR_LSTR005763 [Laodelphax striatellus]
MSSKSVARLSSIPDSREWKSFFIEAGIPAAESATYALTFAQNRIQSDMLVNINKDYLQEMGIKLIGDIIAILRHSRRVHDELQRRTIMKSSASTPAIQPAVPQSKVVSQPATVQGKRVGETKPIKVEKYIDTEEEDEDEEEEDEDEFTEDEEMEEEDEVVQKKVVKSQPVLVKQKQPSIISKAVERPTVPVIASRPIQKVVRKTPIVPVEPQMTVRVTEKPKTLISKKTSVFTRLGDKVEKPPVKIQQKVTLRMDSPEPQAPHSSNASSLPYVGILKNKRPTPPTPIVSKATKKISTISTMRADEEQKRPVKRPAISWVASNAKVKKLNVKDRLGSVSKVNEKPIQVKTLGSTTPRIPIVYNESEVSNRKKVSFGPVQKKEFNTFAMSTNRFRVGWGNS